MGTWCSCVECIGHECEQPVEEEQQAMDHQIKPVHNLDILRSKVDGTWEYRHDLDLCDRVSWSIDDYETIPFGTQEWHRLKQEESQALQILIGDLT